MDADLPDPDRVDLDPYEVEDEVVAQEAEVRAPGPPDADTAAVDPSAPRAEVEPATERDDGAAAAADRLDLDAISADLEGVEAALVRLGDGTYWTDEVTGEPLPDGLLASSPTARRA